MYCFWRLLVFVCNQVYELRTVSPGESCVCLETFRFQDRRKYYVKFALWVNAVVLLYCEQPSAYLSQMTETRKL